MLALSTFFPFVAVLLSFVLPASGNVPGVSLFASPCPTCVEICPINCSTRCPNMDNCDLVPFPQPFCRRWVPCTNDCTCLRSDRPQNASDPVKTPAGLLKCAEFQPCTKDCVCSMRSVTSYLNPDKLDSMSMVCDLGFCNTTCFCRADLLKSLTAVLFPNLTSKFEVNEATADKQTIMELNL